MKTPQNIFHRIDKIQRSHRPLAFMYAVIKKYGEDEAGYQAALFTYYAFLSLFPLLLIITTVADLLARTHPHIRTVLIQGTTNYFPVLGNQLSSHIQTLHKAGLALIVGIVFTLYGARGIADAFRHGVQHIWRVPKKNRESFPKTVIQSLGIILLGGLGFIFASVSSSLTAASGHGWPFRALSIAVNLFILFWLFKYLLNACLPRHIPGRQTRSGAAFAAVGLVILQIFGGYLLSRELKRLDALYSYFAISLGLLFWIYLQAQMLYYAVEVASVRAQGCWPRSLTGRDPTPADKRSGKTSAADY